MANYVDQFWKVVSAMAFLLAGLLAQASIIPSPLLPYKEWIEFVSFILTTLVVWRIRPGGDTDRNKIWTEEQRIRKRLDEEIREEIRKDIEEQERQAKLRL